ncbi:MFS transporter [Amycolatopsis rhizosphaerae]|uniref:MFS transporter n=1 Tax=Amycolatopsis rhizosphaerae TaxID=2053003 RepID=UPI001643DE1E|nr:MFS transporter [Amycolatopsis rhizosphaerae]
MSTTTDPIRSAGAAPSAADRPSWGALGVLLAGIFITTLDFFIVNVAIPSVQLGLHAGPAAVQFVVAGFGLAYAAGLITGGRLGDLHGRRRMFRVGLGVFTVASAACGLAPTPGVLIAARVLQGLGAALLSPQVLAILNVVYTGRHRTAAFNAFGLAMGFGGVFGQLIGGVLIQADIAGLGWRSIFLINVPIGVLAMALAGRLVPESGASGGARLDLTGTVLVSLGLVAIVLPLVQGQQQGWPLWTWLCLAAAVPLLAGFVLHQRRTGDRGGSPLVDLAMFRQRAFSAGVAIGLVYALTTASFFLVLALYLQQGHGLSALGSGLVFLPLGLGYFVSSSKAGQVAARLGRQVLAAGGLIVAVGYLILAVTAEEIGATGAVAWLVPGLLIAGAGMGLVMAPLPATVLAGVRQEHAAAASGVLNAAQQAGGAIGVALVGVVFYRTLGSLGGLAGAFSISELVLAGIGVAVACLVQLLPKAATG